MFGMAEDVPKGAWPLIIGFMFLLGAGYSSLAGRSHPATYHPLTDINGIVTGVGRGRGNRIFINVDQPGVGRVLLQDPELTGAQEILYEVREGSRIVGRYDSWTNKVWELEPSPEHPGFGAREISAWQAQDRAVGHFRAMLLAIFGAVILGIGITLIVRE